MVEGSRNGGTQVTDGQVPGFRRFSTGYGVSIGFALVGLVFLFIAGGAIIEARGGNDPNRAINLFGLPGFLLMWVFLYLIRLIFWHKVSQQRQAQVRMLVSGLLSIEVVVTIFVSALLMSGGGRSASDPSALTAVTTCVMAAICQVATVTWLIRYRSE